VAPPEALLLPQKSGTRAGATVTTINCEEKFELAICFLRDRDPRGPTSHFYPHAVAAEVGRHQDDRARCYVVGSGFEEIVNLVTFGRRRRLRVPDVAIDTIVGRHQEAQRRRRPAVGMTILASRIEPVRSMPLDSDSPARMMQPDTTLIAILVSALRRDLEDELKQPVRLL
jgi:hypothetical protein